MFRYMVREGYCDNVIVKNAGYNLPEVGDIREINGSDYRVVYVDWTGRKYDGVTEYDVTVELVK